MEDQVSKDLEPVRTIAERAFPEEVAEVLRRSRVWVNGKFLDTDNKKVEKWKPVAPQDKVIWGPCMACSEPMYEGDAVGMRGEHEHVVCYDCWITERFTDHHADCCGLKLPGVTLSN